MTTLTERGTRCTCADCATKFFDMNKTPAACPKCGKLVPAAVKLVPRQRKRVETPSPSQDALAGHVIVTHEASPKLKAVKWK